MMMRRITLFVAAVAAYTLLGMALAAATNDPDSRVGTNDQDADWSGTIPSELNHYVCPGDDSVDGVSFGRFHLLSDTNRFIIVIDSIMPRRGQDGKENRRSSVNRKAARLPVIRVDIETGTVTYNGKRCRRDIRAGENE